VVKKSSLLNNGNLGNFDSVPSSSTGCSQKMKNLLSEYLVPSSLGGRISPRPAAQKMTKIFGCKMGSKQGQIGANQGHSGAIPVHFSAF